MTRDEARALLVEQGALVLDAQKRLAAVKRELAEAMHPLLQIDHEIVELFDLDEQEQCFRESAALANVDPNDPAFAPQREAFAQKRGSHLEERLIGQLQNAEWN